MILGSQDIHPARHLLETLAVDQDPSRTPEARRHVAGCRACTSQLAEIDRARAAYLAAYPARDFAGRVAARAARPALDAVSPVLSSLACWSH